MSTVASHDGEPGRAAIDPDLVVPDPSLSVGEAAVLDHVPNRGPA
jgi:hypothetical protein